MAYKALYGGLIFDSPTAYAAVMHVIDTTTGQDTLPMYVDLAAADLVDMPTLRAAIISKTVIATNNAGLGITISASDVSFPFDSAILPGASSYQTIVSQTGTSAPAVSGSLSPISTYPSGTTFTWARTGAGVYTLTASTAVFNTSGKTGVFIGTLNNLNASCKAVVTSSTVITLTTAIGSLLGLGLLGLTATNTDALLTQTMVYVQTY